MRETAVERRLIQKVKQANGICIKIWPVVRGLPDRLVLLPRGRLFLIETKAPDGALRPAQQVFKDRAEAIGVPVAVLYSTREVDAWVEARVREGEES